MAFTKPGGVGGPGGADAGGAAVSTTKKTVSKLTTVTRGPFPINFLIKRIFVTVETAAPPANWTELEFNLGRNADKAFSGYSGEWHKLTKVQYDALVATAAGQRVAQTTGLTYRDFYSQTAVNIRGSIRDVAVGKDAAGLIMFATTDARVEDAYPITIRYFIHESVSVVTSVAGDAE